MQQHVCHAPVRYGVWGNHSNSLELEVPVGSSLIGTMLKVNQNRKRQI